MPNTSANAAVASSAQSGESIVAILLQVAEDALASGDDAGARRNYETALRIDPSSTIARLGLEELDRQTDAEPPDAAAIEPPFAELERDRTLRLAVDPASLVAEKMPPTEALVMSRVVAGTLTVGDITTNCAAIPETVVLLVLSRMFARGIVAYAEED